MDLGQCYVNTQHWSENEMAAAQEMWWEPVTYSDIGKADGNEHISFLIVQHESESVEVIIIIGSEI